MSLLCKHLQQCYHDACELGMGASSCSSGCGAQFLGTALSHENPRVHPGRAEKDFRNAFFWTRIRRFRRVVKIPEVVIGMRLSGRAFQAAAVDRCAWGVDSDLPGDLLGLAFSAPAERFGMLV